MDEVIGNESMSATLRFRIDNADPRVMFSGLRWFYSGRFAGDISDDGVEEITNMSTRTTDSELLTSFSSDGTYFNIIVVNILQDRLGGEATDEGRYFLQATNPAGVSVDFIDLVVYGEHLLCCEIVHSLILCFLSGPPIIITPPEDEFEINGSISIFDCAVLAVPQHYVEWIFTNNDGNSTVIISTKMGNTTSHSKYGINNITSSPSFGQLIITDVVYSDRGQYMCRAINRIGTDTAAANLTVHGM